MRWTRIIIYIHLPTELKEEGIKMDNERNDSACYVGVDTYSGTNLQDQLSSVKNVKSIFDTHDTYLKATSLKRKKYSAFQLSVSAVFLLISDLSNHGHVIKQSRYDGSFFFHVYLSNNCSEVHFIFSQNYPE